MMNRTVLMSGADYFSDQFAINALMDSAVPVNRPRAIKEHTSIKEALESAGIKVITVDPPPDLQDGVYTANWALVRGGTALLARLPNKRQPEEAYATRYLQAQGFNVALLPANVSRFSGQGDSLACGDIVFTQSPYRTSQEAHNYLKSVLGFKTVYALQTKPSRWLGIGPIKKNAVTGWPDSPTYDIDLALAVLKWPSEERKGLIAWCPDVFTRSSRQLLQTIEAVDTIKVSKKEAMQAYALNLVSTGETVIMNAGAPLFQGALEANGFKTITLELPELKKGGGSIRCTTLTLDN
jgi:N-dimethylarginine dimethylaminohydrolase